MFFVIVNEHTMHLRERKLQHTAALHLKKVTHKFVEQPCFPALMACSRNHCCATCS